MSTGDIGPTPPDWVEPDAAPEYHRDTSDGVVVIWERALGGLTWISCEDTTADGRVLRSSPVIH